MLGGPLQSPALRFPPQAPTASCVARSNPGQSFYANNATIAQEPPDALVLMVEAEAFEKDQPAMALVLNH
jgi:hypothetical protein